MDKQKKLHDYSFTYEMQKLIFLRFKDKQNILLKISILKKNLVMAKHGFHLELLKRVQYILSNIHKWMFFRLKAG